VRRIGAEALRRGALLERRLDAHAVCQQAGVCDHDAVVDAEPAKTVSDLSICLGTLHELTARL